MKKAEKKLTDYFERARLFMKTSDENGASFFLTSTKDISFLLVEVAKMIQKEELFA